MVSERLTDWLAIAANLGVVAGLMLLLLELRQNSALMRVQISQARADSAIALTGFCDRYVRFIDDARERCE